MALANRQYHCAVGICTTLREVLAEPQTSSTTGVLSYAEIASKGPKQTPEELSESISTSSSLIDVDTPSVRTVPSDFESQSVKTDTQADRIEREDEAKQRAKEAKAAAEELAAKARAEADLAKKSAKSKARKADSWITKKFESMSDGSSGALVAANLIAVVGLSGWLGFKAWGLFEKGRLDWKTAGLGLGVLGVVGAVEGVFAGYIKKAKANKKQ
ncbi:hypothetical protein B0T17DRAFT_608988 [Bombardia bombarda]|uniref:Mitochondrial outer membrane protein OM14 C-terminal domain-containing protein n=1 Tax=Bombardia bombarda TaxID=252184 RepID=A0AA39WUR7_9PEZI|nr:hypothetical protein B0T17DRAFT_608988 [Bombardia bombarda]